MSRSTPELETDAPVERGALGTARRRARTWAEVASSGVGYTLLKILGLAVLDAIVLFLLFVLLLDENWLIFAVVLVTAIVVNAIYLAPPSKRGSPAKASRGGRIAAKYLAPGVLFLLIFQVFVVVFSGYIAFTNYGDGHTGSKPDAIAVINLTSQQRVENSPTYRLTVLDQLGSLSFLVTEPDGSVSIGGDERPLEPVTGAQLDSTGKAIGLDGYTTLDFAGILSRQGEIGALAVPLTDDLGAGGLRTPDGSSAYLYQPTMQYDEATDTFTRLSDGTVYADRGNGAYETEAGASINPGWKIDVGVDNFARAFGEESIRGPLIGVAVWTFVFAGLSVFLCFALGLFLAIVFNDWRMRGRKFYRIVIILPYAFPSFLSGLVWAGLLNQDFGFVNNVLLGGADIPWLTDAILAKISVLLVNLWLGFPYMFLVCTGALQSIPDELIEAARVDGARPWAVFRLIKLPLLLVSIAPLLISSFAFNFNNFNIIYMLTRGGPRDVSAGIDVGATDLLITLVYKVAFGQGTGRDYGLASAFAILIFIVVGTISVISFRKTRALEEVN